MHSAAGHCTAFINFEVQGARIGTDRLEYFEICTENSHACISGLVAEYIVAIDVTRVRFSADAFNMRDVLGFIHFWMGRLPYALPQTRVGYYARICVVFHSRAWFRSTDLWVMGPTR